jgi:hypothetical protein
MITRKWIKLSESSGFGMYVDDEGVVFTYSRKHGKSWIIGRKYYLPSVLAKRVLKEEFVGEKSAN